MSAKALGPSELALEAGGPLRVSLKRHYAHGDSN